MHTETGTTNKTSTNNLISPVAEQSDVLIQPTPRAKRFNGWAVHLLVALELHGCGTHMACPLRGR